MRRFSSYSAKTKRRQCGVKARTASCCLLALFHGLLLLLGLIKMIETSHVGNKQFKVTYKFPPSFQKRDRDAAKAWAGKLASRESGFDELQHKLATARQAPQYQGVVVGLEEIAGVHRCALTAGNSCQKLTSFLL